MYAGIKICRLKVVLSTERTTSDTSFVLQTAAFQKCPTSVLFKYLEVEPLPFPPSLCKPESKAAHFLQHMRPRTALWVSGIHIPSWSWAELSPAAIKGNGKQHSAYYNVCTNYICNVQHSPCKHTAADRGGSIQYPFIPLSQFPRVQDLLPVEQGFKNILIYLDVCTVKEKARSRLWSKFS